MKRRNTGPDKLTVEVVIGRDRGQCAWCGDRVFGERGVDWAIHHRRPRRMGGDPRPDVNLPSNLVLLHEGASGCHMNVEQHRAIGYDRGFILAYTSRPCSISIEHAVHGWVYLTDDGEAVSEPPMEAA